MLGKYKVVMLQFPWSLQEQKKLFIENEKGSFHMEKKNESWREKV